MKIRTVFIRLSEPRPQPIGSQIGILKNVGFAKLYNPADVNEISTKVPTTAPIANNKISSILNLIIVLKIKRVINVAKVRMLFFQNSIMKPKVNPSKTNSLAISFF